MNELTHLKERQLLDTFRQLTGDEQADFAVLALMDVANSGTGRSIAAAISRHLPPQHRTIQQSFVRGVVQGLQLVGDECGNSFDPRNQQAMEFCKSLKEMNLHFPLI